jgi:hypothetical protein
MAIGHAPLLPAVDLHIGGIQVDGDRPVGQLSRTLRWQQRQHPPRDRRELLPGRISALAVQPYEEVLMGTWQATPPWKSRAWSPSGRSRGLPARSTPSRSMAGDACAEIGGIWLVLLVPGDPLTSPGLRTSCRRSGRPAPSRRHRFVSDTPGRFQGAGCSCRYGWSWPEPPAGGTPHRYRSRRAPGKTGACGQLGSRTADRMAVPLSPSIRERACPAWLGPA